MSNLPENFREQHVASMFKERNFEIGKTKLLYDDLGSSKGAGFIEFTCANEAQKAVQECNGAALGSRRLICAMARS